MANIPLQSITFPGLSDKYTTPTVDATLTQTGAAADAKKTGDEIGAIKNDLSEFPNGNYPQMGAGYANQLVSGLKKADSTPYNFRAVPYDATLEDVKKIVGGTVAWNQLVGTTDTSITVQSGHKAYKSINGTASVFTSDGTAITVTGGTDIVIDLTQMFGTTIADYVLSLETATAGAGVAWLKTHFPKQFDNGYQAYDAGTLKSIEGLSEHKTVGFNQWDEVWETYGSVQIKSKNRIRLFGGVTYYAKTPSVGITLYFKKNKDDVDNIGQITVVNNTFVVPSNANYAVMYTGANYGNVYNHDICINLSDPTKNGEYEPYEAHSYALDSDVVLRGIPKLDSNNQLHYDGDEYLPDGTVNRRYGIVDLGTLTWYKTEDSRLTVGYYFNVDYAGIPIENPNKVNSKYPMSQIVGLTDIISTYGASIDKIMFAASNTMIYIIDSAFTDAASLKASLSGVYMVYKKATPTTETALPYQETQIVDDFGTEEFVLADGAFPVPVGHETYYQNNLRAKLEMSPDSPDGDGLYVVQQESGENTYVPLASTATIQDILTRLTALENA